MILRNSSTLLRKTERRNIQVNEPQKQNEKSRRPRMNAAKFNVGTGKFLQAEIKQFKRKNL